MADNRACAVCQLVAIAEDRDPQEGDLDKLAIAAICAGISIGQTAVENAEHFFCDEHVAIFLDCMSTAVHGK